MPGRNLSDGQRRWFTAELEFLTSRGLLDAAQTARILAEYETADDTSARKASLGRLALQSVAATFVGVAVLLVVAYNWQALHWVGKLVVVFGTVLASNAAALYLRFALSRRGISEVVFLLAGLLYGSAIWLVAQVFHLSAHGPDGVWWWAVGVIPVALALQTPLVHLLVASLLAIWAGTEIVGYRHLPFWWWHALPNGAFSLPLLVAPGIAWAYRRGSAWGLSAYVAVLSWWLVLQAFAWHYDRYSVLVVGVVGPVLLILAENHRVGNPLSAPYRFWGVLLTGGALIPLSYLDFHKRWWYWNREAVEAEHLVLWVLGVILAAVLAAVAVLLRPLGSAPLASPWSRLTAIARRQWVPLAIVGVMALNAIFSATRPFTTSGRIVPGAWWPTLLANGAMVALALWMIRVGLREERGRTFAAGIVYLLLWAVLRYFDLFGEAGGVLGAALIFLLCGLTLFGLAMWWGRRKELRHV